MPRAWVSWTLFFSSYTPLFVLLCIRSVGKDGTLPLTIASGSLILLGAAGTVVFITAAERRPDADYELIHVERRDADVSAYAATYILPFVTVLEGGWRDVVSLGAFVIFLGVVYVRSRLIYVNPVLFLMGLHLWRVVPQTPGAPPTTVKWPRFLLADTTQLRPDMTISAHSLSDDLLLLKEIK